MSELEVLTLQLRELMAGAPEEDPYEIAEVAGLIARLDPTADVLGDAESWRDGEGADALDEAWESFDPWELLEAVEACLRDGADPDALEEAVSDVDDAVAAAIWCDRGAEVEVIVAQLTGLVEGHPAVFTPLRPLAEQITEGIGGREPLYRFWSQMLSLTEA